METLSTTFVALALALTDSRAPRVAARVWRRRLWRLRRAVLPHAITDPLTGDHLTAGEAVSWRLQGIIRRWTFLGAITVATFCCWATRNPDILLWWNLCASYLAIFIESIVGLSMFSQTKRDAVVMRHSETMSAALLALQQQLEAREQALEAREQALEARLATLQTTFETRFGEFEGKIERALALAASRGALGGAASAPSRRSPAWSFPLPNREPNRELEQGDA